MSTKSPAEGDHWTFEGVKGGGGVGVGDFEKKSCKRMSEEKNCKQHKLK